jgi:hypothetical protein
MKPIFANNVSGFLAAPLTSTALSMQVDATLAGLLAGIINTPGSEFFVLTLSDPQMNPSYETVKVSSVSGTTVNLSQRNYDANALTGAADVIPGTGVAWAAGSTIVSIRLTAKHLNRLLAIKDDAATFPANGKVGVNAAGNLIPSPAGFIHSHIRLTAPVTASQVLIVGYNATFSNPAVAVAIYINGLRQSPTFDYVLTLSGADTVITYKDAGADTILPVGSQIDAYLTQAT